MNDYKSEFLKKMDELDERIEFLNNGRNTEKEKLNEIKNYVKQEIDKTDDSVVFNTILSTILLCIPTFAGITSGEFVSLFYGLAADAVIVFIVRECVNFVNKILEKQYLSKTDIKIIEEKIREYDKCLTECIALKGQLVEEHYNERNSIASETNKDSNSLNNYNSVKVKIRKL